MKKKFLKHFNLLLGTISLTLAGCHTQKQVAQTTDNDPADQTKIEQVEQDERVICLYGPPPTQKADTTATDSVADDEIIRPALKYGVPPVRRKI